MPRESEDMLKSKDISKKRAGYKRTTKLERWGGRLDWYKQLNNMNEKSMRRFLNEVVKNTERRLVSLEKNVDSYAAFKLRQDISEFDEKRKKGELNRWQMSSLLSKYHDFWSSLGSTKEGANKINREQDARIFGETTNALGKKIPAYTMSHDERVKYWSAYMEFLNQNKEIPQTRDNSTRIQRLLGQYVTDIEPSELQRVLDKVLADFREESKAQPTKEERGIAAYVRGRLKGTKSKRRSKRK